MKPIRRILPALLCFFCVSACSMLPAPAPRQPANTEDTAPAMSTAMSLHPPSKVTPPVMTTDLEKLPAPYVTPEPEKITEPETPIPEVSSEPATNDFHIRIAFGGDTLLYGGVSRALDSGSHDAVIDPTLAELLREADLSIVNLEMPFSKRGEPMPDKTFTFRGNPAHIPFLTETMGIDVVSLANNHTLDYGIDALLDTLDSLRNSKIGYAGAGCNLEEAAAPYVTEIQGKTIAFLAASRVIPVAGWNAGKNNPGLLTTYDPTRLNAAITDANELYDYVLVYVHWGVEGASQPEDYQVKLAEGYIKAGADAVIGTHPHILQGFALVDNKPVAYSLGNFIFTSSRPETCVVILNITGDDLWLEAVPCTIKSPYTALVNDTDTFQKRLQMLTNLSSGVYFDESGRLRPNSAPSPA